MVFVGRIYGLYDSRFPEDCRYIGKTIRTLNTRLRDHHTEAKGKAKHHRATWIRSVLDAGATLIIKDFEHYFYFDREELKRVGSGPEKKWIASGREQGYDLVNGTDGGEGVVGYTYTDEARAKMSAAKKGKPLSSEHCAKLSAALIGNQYALGMRHTPETKAKMSEQRKGNQHRLGIPHTEETKAKLRGRKASDETRAKQSASQKARYARIREERTLTEEKA